MVGEKAYKKNSLLEKRTKFPPFSFSGILNGQPFKTSFKFLVDVN